jgi:hypothetical protein
MNVWNTAGSQKGVSVVDTWYTFYSMKSTISFSVYNFSSNQASSPSHLQSLGYAAFKSGSP